MTSTWKPFVALLLASLAVAPAFASAPRTVVETYVAAAEAPPVSPPVRSPLLESLGPTRDPVCAFHAGRACFYAYVGETTAHIQVQDHSGLTVGAAYRFFSSSSNDTVEGELCGEAVVPIPTHLRNLHVFPGPLGACHEILRPAHFATAGAVAVTFT